MAFDDGVKGFGVPVEVMTDHGSQFCEDENKRYRFRDHIVAAGVKKHVLACVKHLQTNGKCKKRGGTIKGIMKWKNCTMGEAVKFYNEYLEHSPNFVGS
ncbi:MAG: hypothetical protein M1569_01695 [Candidatus Marsarchaeota archaeon]|nr:hypothetical protein [Candidatus Marsarchaeota archaeon]MCL5413095.1 hypothetical protein [Candidatus Marsarchaeota archaeon]